MSLQTKIEQEKNKSPEKDDKSSSRSEELISLTPKRQNQKHTPPATATRKSTRNRQATLAISQGNPIPNSTIQIASATGKKQFEIDSPPKKSTQDFPSLKSLIQEIGFFEKKEYKACVQFIEAISPKHKPITTNNIIDLTSPTEAEDETMENNILFVNTKDTEVKGREDKHPQNNEEHDTMTKTTTTIPWKQENKNEETGQTVPRGLKTQSVKLYQIFPRRGNVIRHG